MVLRWRRRHLTIAFLSLGHIFPRYDLPFPTPFQPYLVTSQAIKTTFAHEDSSKIEQKSVSAKLYKYKVWLESYR
jgi:hypothetical protein